MNSAVDTKKDTHASTATQEKEGGGEDNLVTV